MSAILRNLSVQLVKQATAKLQCNTHDSFLNLPADVPNLPLFLVPIRHISAEFDDRKWREGIVSWYYNIEFRLPYFEDHPYKVPRTIGGSFDIYLSELEQDTDISSLRMFRKKHGKSISRAIIENIKRFIEVQNESRHSK